MHFHPPELQKTKNEQIRNKSVKSFSSISSTHPPILVSFGFCVALLRLSSVIITGWFGAVTERFLPSLSVLLHSRAQSHIVPALTLTDSLGRAWTDLWIFFFLKCHRSVVTRCHLCLNLYCLKWKGRDVCTVFTKTLFRNDVILGRHANYWLGFLKCIV